MEENFIEDVIEDVEGCLADCDVKDEACIAKASDCQSDGYARVPLSDPPIGFIDRDNEDLSTANPVQFVDRDASVPEQQ